MRSIFVFIVTLFLAGCATTGIELHSHGEKFTRHYPDSIFKTTEKGLFSVEMVLMGKELKTGVNDVEIIVHDKDDRDVVGADITVTPWMPEMGHGVFERLVITERGGGLYSINNIVLNMSGYWQLRIKIKKGYLEDRVIFDFPAVKTTDMHKKHEHKIMQAPTPPELDLSKKQISENKTFYVSYESELEPIPINKIHSWRLRVETSDGQPVRGAEITIDGDMPEHGHGLPTRPEVTQEFDNGYYIVEGLKFSMPGWWKINFHIKARDMEDSVTFNLFLR